MDWVNKVLSQVGFRLTHIFFHMILFSHVFAT